jgi:hypothetical protein
MGQYVMFTFTYKLRSFKGPVQKDDRMMFPGMRNPHGDGPPPGMNPGMGPGMGPGIE